MFAPLFLMLVQEMQTLTPTKGCSHFPLGSQEGYEVPVMELFTTKKTLVAPGRATSPCC